MLQKLVFPDGDHPHVLLPVGIHSVGAAPDNDIVLRRAAMPDYAVALQRHPPRTQLVPANDVDLRVNDRPVREVTLVRAGDEILVAGVRMRLVELAADASGLVAPSEEVLAMRAMGALPSFELRMLQGPGIGTVHPLSGPLVIGRAHDCDIVVALQDVSRRHAMLRPLPNGVAVEDLGSTNGVWVDGRTVRHAVIPAGFELRIGGALWRVTTPGDTAPPRTRAWPRRASPTPSRVFAFTAILLAALLVCAALVALFVAR